MCSLHCGSWYVAISLYKPYKESQRRAVGNNPLYLAYFHWDCQQSSGDQVSGKIKEDELMIGVCSDNH